MKIQSPENKPAVQPKKICKRKKNTVTFSYADIVDNHLRNIYLRTVRSVNIDAANRTRRDDTDIPF